MDALRVMTAMTQLGKYKYGEPFSEEEVEDVRTVLRPMIGIYDCVWSC